MPRPEIPAYLLAGVAIAAAVVLIVTGNAVPAWISLVAVGGLAGGTGLTTPTPGAGNQGLPIGQFVHSIEQVIYNALNQAHGTDVVVRPVAPPPAPVADTVPPAAAPAGPATP